MSGLFTAMTGAGTQADPAAEVDRGDAAATRCSTLRMLDPLQLVAAHRDPAGHADARRRDAPAARSASCFGAGVRLQTEQDPERPNPTYIPAADAGRPLVRGADRRHRPERAHRVDPEHPDHRPHPRRRRDRRRRPSAAWSTPRNRVFGYENLLVCDGAAIPANPGVNPSLTITALGRARDERWSRRRTASRAAPPARGGAAGDARRCLALSPRSAKRSRRRSPS